MEDIIQPTIPVKPDPGISTSELKVTVGIPMLDVLLRSFLESDVYPEDIRFAVYALGGLFVAGRVALKAVTTVLSARKAS